jgi:hypothetical protein
MTATKGFIASVPGCAGHLELPGDLLGRVVGVHGGRGHPDVSGPTVGKNIKRLIKLNIDNQWPYFWSCVALI